MYIYYLYYDDDDVCVCMYSSWWHVSLMDVMLAISYVMYLILCVMFIYVFFACILMVLWLM